jgi:hypothetical protein
VSTLSDSVLFMTLKKEEKKQRKVNGEVDKKEMEETRKNMKK